MDNDLELVERRRLHALIDGDIAEAARLHHDDFQLVTPGASAIGKAEYLGLIESGVLNYLVWEPEAIDVRMAGDAACLRYAAALRALYQGADSGLGRYWHTDYYERNSGTWQVVFSQATGPART